LHQPGLGALTWPGMYEPNTTGRSHSGSAAAT
jgi:hypothetical protein